MLGLGALGTRALGQLQSQTAIIVGWEAQLPHLTTNSTIYKRYSGIKSKSGFAAFPQPFPEGWQVQPYQPPFQPTIRQRSGALSHPEEGIEGVFVASPSQIFLGYEFPPISPRKVFKGLDQYGNVDTQFINFLPYGWEIQYVQPPAFPKTNIKIGALSQWEDGIEGQFIVFHPFGWEIQPPQPPHQFIEKRGSILRGDDGTEGIFINFLPFSFEVQPPQPPFRVNQNRGTILKGDDGTVGIYINFLPYGWEIQPPQPPHTFFEKKGSILRGIDGIEGILVNFFPFGWEIQPYQPPFSPKISQKTGALSHPEEGIEAPYIFVPATQPIWGLDIQPSPSRLYDRGGAWSQCEDGIEFPLINFFPDGWEIQPYQPPFYPKINQKISATSQWEDGIEFPFIFVAPGQIIDGWEIQAFQPPFWLRINQKLGSVSQWEDGIEYPFINWKNMGWEIQPFQPPHIFVEKRGLILLGDDGIEGKFIRFFPYGWEIQPPQPPFFPTIGRKYGALSHPEEGIEGLYIFVARNVDLNPIGWVIQIPQPPHPRPERSGAWMFGELGIEAPYKFVAPTIKNFEFLIKWRR